MSHLVTIDGGPLSFDDIIQVAHGGSTVRLHPAAAERMEAARSVVATAVEENRTVYGITTGFGALASTRIDPEQAETLQVHLLRSHAAGVGPPVPAPIVRTMLLLRARTLSQGYSGVRPVVVERILELLNHDVLPVIPGQGSVGASGDLAPFAHLALPLIGEGEVEVGGTRLAAADALNDAGIEPLRLTAKEGLSLLNGTEGMLAYGIISLHRARRLAAAADLACAMSIGALMGSSRPFQPAIHELRPHPGQVQSASVIAGLLEGSAIQASHHDDFVHAVQDAYSLRCAPQVHGATRDALAYAAATFEVELRSVVDNPIVFPETGEVVSAGNFHGQPLALALDVMAIAITELGSISERRTDRLLDPNHSSGLPAFLSPEPGINSGYMLTQYTAASLIAENRVLSHPASVESIPTSGSQEDHVSMGWGAARKLWDVLMNTRRVLAIEILCAAQGLEYRKPLLPSDRVQAAVAHIRASVPPLDDDRPLTDEIEALAWMVATGELLEAARIT
ncbi:MAG: histidine ammonia-lyase [Acidimicrobiia bacterium]|nr:histidine ammonia-lyase [Acidimicrobiia bacterium]MBT8215542.1 histidine ammonia-lyase [Acidimicrobiia bacterium]NNF11077.1 histidine ammonia-lyase [Acidimicrobiia bacterium]NNL69924.1 histidine ammonia-lyase [Acidimicrobiia bacterium]